MGNVNFFILIWKNFKLQVRPRWVTPVELLIPVLLMLLLVLTRHLISVEQGMEETVFEPYDINVLPEQYYNTSKEYRIYYAPSSDYLDDIMMSVASYLNVSITGLLIFSRTIFYELSLDVLFGFVLFAKIAKLYTFISL